MKLTPLILACTLLTNTLSNAQLPHHPAPGITPNPDGTYSQDWTGQPGITYFIQYSLDLHTWSYMPVIESGDGTPVSYGFESDSARMFLRLHYTDHLTTSPNSDDFDGDGISNWDEVRIGGTGTSPLKADTNGDGIRDDGLVYNAESDPDGVGLLASLGEDLTRRWDFEQLSGNVYPNVADATYPAAVGGSVPIDNGGIISKASSYDSNGDWLKIDPRIFNQNPNNSIALSFCFQKDWVQNKSTSIVSARYTTFWSYNTENDILPKLVLSVYKAVTPADRQKILLSTYESGALVNLMTALVPQGEFIDDANWHQLTYVQDGAVGSIWLDGVKLAEASIGNKLVNATSAGWFTIGKSFPTTATATNDTNFRGKIDRLKTYGKALSAAEIDSLYKQDADGDGLYDWYEARYNPTRAVWQDDPNGDPDRDELGNLAEQAAGADMRDADTDNDLLPDGYEVAYGLSPTDPTGDNGAAGDPDGDTLVNLDEYIHATAPNNVDTDGDLTNDNVEVVNQGLPNDASDNGEPANPSDIITLQLSIGDPSVSESERYVLLAKDLSTGKTVVAHVSPVFGEVDTKVYDKFRRGHSYAFSVKHLDTEDGKVADYDYFSEVKFTVPADAAKYVWFDPFDSGEKEIVMPPNGQKVLMDARTTGGEPLGTGGGGSQDFIESIEPLKALLVTADLDIDSNNNEGFVFEKGSKEEDGIEAAAGLPGKVVPLNINDTDGVVDWADGFDVNSADTHDDILTETDFVPFILTLPGSHFNPDDVEIIFRYDASDPAAVSYAARSYTVTGKSDYDYMLPADGTMRIWTKNADQMRKKESLVGMPKGDFIPKDEKIKWSDIAESGENKVKLYLEGVKGQGLKNISVDVYYKGSQIIQEADKINVTLLKAEMVPDYNRDGKIDASDRDEITAVNPWRWWINDDDDKASEDRGKNDYDIPGQSGNSKDCSDLAVDGTRDLIDFFPLHLDLQQALDILPSTDFRYVLKHEDGAIKYYQSSDVVLDGSISGLKVDSYFKNVGTAAVLGSVNVSLADSQGSELSGAMLQGAIQGKGILLVEGCTHTTAPLVLEIIHKEQGTTAARFEFPLNIANVEEMYRHVNMRDLTGGSGGNATQTDEPDGYPDRLTNGKYVAYIHGFKVDGESARGSQSNIFKRLHRLGSKARYIGISWYGDPPPPNPAAALLVPDYHRALYNGLVTSMTARVRLKFTQNADFTVLAHSLGNSVISNAICHHNLDLDRYYIINGAIALEAYDDSQTANSSGHTDMKRNMTEDDWKPFYDYDAGSQRRLFAANWHQLFDPTDNRSKLTWKNHFAKPELLSVAYNFYSPSDEVVENAGASEQFGSNLINALISTDFGRHSWVNQEIAKGGQNGIAGSLFHELNGGWQFNGEWFVAVPQGTPEPRTPAQAAGITNEQLKTEPFHKAFVFPDLYDPAQGSATAGITLNRYKLLATGIPAMSYAIAANEAQPFLPVNTGGEQRNFNMPSEMKNPNVGSSWPEHPKAKQPGDWMHSDFKDVALPFVHPLFQKMIDLAELDED